MIKKADLSPKIRRDLLKVLEKHLDMKKYQVFLFGSRVVGRNLGRSDIDIGIDGDSPLPASIKLELEAELDKLPILYKIDLVDFKKVSARFKNEAKKYIDPLN